MEDSGLTHRLSLWFAALPPPTGKSRLTPPSEIRAVRVIPAPRERVFAFLADLENHWLITDRFVRVLSLEGPAGARRGGEVWIRAPFGLSRTASIRVEKSRPPAELVGSAAVGAGTRAEVRWSLSEETSGTRAELTARLITASRPDRLLWMAGGRFWMQHRLQRALAGLDARCR
jgi:uncharacterized protein YndB with AHSA1/START domain